MEAHSLEGKNLATWQSDGGVWVLKFEGKQYLSDFFGPQGFVV